MIDKKKMPATKRLDNIHIHIQAFLYIHVLKKLD